MKRTARLIFTVCLCLSILPVCGAELPATLYCNPNGGSYYHVNPACPSVKEEYLPMTAFDSALLGTPEYGDLLPCTLCIGAAELPAGPRRAMNDVQKPVAANVTIGSEAAARAAAEAFFASPYLNETLDGRVLTLTKIPEGWQAVLAPADEAQPTLTVWLTADGRVQQFENSAYALPTLADMDSQSIPLDDLRRIDTLRNALFPDMPNNTCGLYARDGEASFYDLDSDTFWLGLVLNTDLIKLVAYVDLETDAARYPGYLTRGEAAAAAKRALAEAYGLTAKQTEGLVLIQSVFTMDARRWTDADVPVPYWFLVLGDEADGTKTRYEALIDAETGDTLELHDPDSVGNG